MLDLSVCVLQGNPQKWYPIAADGTIVALGTLMCLLVVIRFARESLQMYKVSNQFQVGRYMSLLARDGVLYYLVYVSIPRPCHLADGASL